MKEATPNKPRIQYFDLAKGICILLVVWFHLGVQSALNVYLDPVRMPLYFFLSGFFFKTYGGFSAFLYKKTNKLLVPFAFFYLTTSCLLPLVAHHASGINFSTGNDWSLLYAFLTYNDFPNIPLWFLWGLFTLNIVFYGLRNKIRHDFLLGAVCLVLQIILGHATELPASQSKAFSGLFFFYLGYAVHRNDLMRYSDNLAVILLSFCIYTALGQLCPAGEVWRMSIQTLMSLLGIAILFYICRRINHLPYISYVGRYSIIVLVTHEPIIRILSMLHINSPYIMYAVILVSYLAIIPIMRKYLPHVTAQKDIHLWKTYHN